MGVVRRFACSCKRRIATNFVLDFIRITWQIPFPLLQDRIMLFICAEGGHAVTQLVEALRYKPKGRGFDSRWCH